MDKLPLVSIIIPTYNREQLITETLDSVLAQNYTQWECLVIDDGSTDNTEVVLKGYIDNDTRFKYYKRPDLKPKGANACRNIGLEQAIGDYIIFFDSDDLMTLNHIEIKLEALQKNDYDFVIAQTRFFNSTKQNTILEKQYQYETKDINAFNYISHKINWLTYDLCISAKLSKTIRFNENLQSGQEYNYFSKLILLSTNAVFIKEIVTLRRYHENSIRGDLRSDKIMSLQGYLTTYWETYLDIMNIASKAIKRFLVYRCYRLLGKLPINEKLFENNINKAVLKEFGMKGFYYLLRLYLKRIV